MKKYLLQVNDVNPFEIKSAKIHISQGLSYKDYKFKALSHCNLMQYVMNDFTIALEVPITLFVVSNFKYDELIIDAFLSIQSNVEDDSFLKHLDYSYMDVEDILKYVEKYHMYI